MHNDCSSEQYVHEQLFHLFRKIPVGEFIDGRYQHCFSTDDKWTSTIRSIIDILELLPNHSIVNVQSAPAPAVTVGLNDKYINRLVPDVYKISYNLLYPTIITRMDKAEHAYIDISLLVSTIVKFRKHIKLLMKEIPFTESVWDVYDIAQMNSKVFINYLYGKCNRCEYLGADFSISEYVRTEVASMWRRINSYLGDDVIHFDTDEAYVVAHNHTEAEIFKAFDSALIDYEYEVKPCMGFHRKKMVYEFPEMIPYFKINNTKITPL
jgi:hypothetical protein